MVDLEFRELDNVLHLYNNRSSINALNTAKGIHSVKIKNAYINLLSDYFHKTVYCPEGTVQYFNLPVHTYQWYD